MTSSFGMLPLTKKVGEVSEKDEKFSSWSGVHGYYSRPETEFDPFKTDKMLHSKFDVDTMKSNLSLCKSMRATNKSAVEFKPRVDGDSRMLGTSMSMETFVDHRSMRERMKENGTIENFQYSFQKILDDQDDSGKGLSIKNIYLVVEDCLGEDFPTFITDKFIELSKKNSFGGRITWAQFCVLIPQVSAAVEADCMQKRELPALMVLMNRPRIVDKKLGSLGESSTTYRDNFNKTFPVAFKDDFQGFHFREAEKDARSSLNAASKVLCAGTVKGTYQVPGYRGHIPRNIRNSRKVEHSDGKQPHPVCNNLRLTQRGMGCVLGYTGHVPHETSGLRAERTTACDPRTTNGAAFGPVRAYL